MDNKNKQKNLEISTKFNPSTQKYEPDTEELTKKLEELNKKEEKSENKKVETVNPYSNKNKKQGSFRPIIFIMIISLLIASLWDKMEWIKNSVHFILDPTAGALMDWNLNFGMLIVVLVITYITTLVQKHATDQETLKELKKEQKEIQKEMKKFKNHPEKLKDLQKKQFALMPKQMKLSMRALVYTGVPFILFFRWFNDYFANAGDPKLWLGMSWFLFYLLGAIIIGSVLRKQMDVV